MANGFGPFGAFLYGFFNRLLIPTGLHHALNAVFWFDRQELTISVNSNWTRCNQRYYWSISSRGSSQLYDVWYAAALAMYHTAEICSEKNYGWFIASSISAFIVGVTEPIEFAFMFVAPVLFVIHAIINRFVIIYSCTIPLDSRILI